MVKKFIAILFCSVACVIHFAHSAVPHSHTTEHQHGGHSDHHHHHTDNSDNEDNSLAHLFSHFAHSAEVFTNHAIEDVKLTNVGVIKPAFFEIHLYNSKHTYSDSDAQHKIRDEGYIYISPHLLSLKFRGPPAV